MCVPVSVYVCVFRMYEWCGVDAYDMINDLFREYVCCVHVFVCLCVSYMYTWCVFDSPEHRRELKPTHTHT